MSQQDDDSEVEIIEEEEKVQQPLIADNQPIDVPDFDYGQVPYVDMGQLGGGGGGGGLGGGMGDVFQQLGLQQNVNLDDIIDLLPDDESLQADARAQNLTVGADSYENTNTFKFAAKKMATQIYKGIHEQNFQIDTADEASIYYQPEGAELLAQNNAMASMYPNELPVANVIFDNIEEQSEELSELPITKRTRRDLDIVKSKTIQSELKKGAQIQKDKQEAIQFLKERQIEPDPILVSNSIGFLAKAAGLRGKISSLHQNLQNYSEGDQARNVFVSTYNDATRQFEQLASQFLLTETKAQAERRKQAASQAPAAPVRRRDRAQEEEKRVEREVAQFRPEDEEEKIPPPRRRGEKQAKRLASQQERVRELVYPPEGEIQVSGPKKRRQERQPSAQVGFEQPKKRRATTRVRKEKFGIGEPGAFTQEEYNSLVNHDIALQYEAKNVSFIGQLAVSKPLQFMLSTSAENLTPTEFVKYQQNVFPTSGKDMRNKFLKDIGYDSFIEEVTSIVSSAAQKKPQRSRLQQSLQYNKMVEYFTHINSKKFTLNQQLRDLQSNYYQQLQNEPNQQEQERLQGDARTLTEFVARLDVEQMRFLSTMFPLVAKVGTLLENNDNVVNDKSVIANPHAKEKQYVLDVLAAKGDGMNISYHTMNTAPQRVATFANTFEAFLDSDRSPESFNRIFSQSYSLDATDAQNPLRAQVKMFERGQDLLAYNSSQMLNSMFEQLMGFSRDSFSTKITENPFNTLVGVFNNGNIEKFMTGVVQLNSLSSDVFDRARLLRTSDGQPINDSAKVFKDNISAAMRVGLGELFLSNALDSQLKVGKEKYTGLRAIQANPPIEPANALAQRPAEMIEEFGAPGYREALSNIIETNMQQYRSKQKKPEWVGTNIVGLMKVNKQNLMTGIQKNQARDYFNIIKYEHTRRLDLPSIEAGPIPQQRQVEEVKRGSEQLIDLSNTITDELLGDGQEENTYDAFNNRTAFEMQANPIVTSANAQNLNAINQLRERTESIQQNFEEVKQGGGGGGRGERGRPPIFDPDESQTIYNVQEGTYNSNIFGEGTLEYNQLRFGMQPARQREIAEIGEFRQVIVDKEAFKNVMNLYQQDINRLKADSGLTDLKLQYIGYKKADNGNFIMYEDELDMGQEKADKSGRKKLFRDFVNLAALEDSTGKKDLIAQHSRKLCKGMNPTRSAVRCLQLMADGEFLRQFAQTLLSNSKELANVNYHNRDQLSEQYQPVVLEHGSILTDLKDRRLFAQTLVEVMSKTEKKLMNDILSEGALPTTVSFFNRSGGFLSRNVLQYVTRLNDVVISKLGTTTSQRAETHLQDNVYENATRDFNGIVSFANKLIEYSNYKEVLVNDLLKEGEDRNVYNYQPLLYKLQILQENDPNIPESQERAGFVSDLALSNTRQLTNDNQGYLPSMEWLDLAWNQEIQNDSPVENFPTVFSAMEMFTRQILGVRAANHSARQMAFNNQMIENVERDPSYQESLTQTQQIAKSLENSIMQDNQSATVSEDMSLAVKSYATRAAINALHEDAQVNNDLRSREIALDIDTQSYQVGKAVEIARKYANESSEIIESMKTFTENLSESIIDLTENSAEGSHSETVKLIQTDVNNDLDLIKEVMNNVIDQQFLQQADIINNTKGQKMTISHAGTFITSLKEQYALQRRLLDNEIVHASLFKDKQKTINMIATQQLSMNEQGEVILDEVNTLEETKDVEDILDQNEQQMDILDGIVQSFGGETRGEIDPATQFFLRASTQQAVEKNMQLAQVMYQGLNARIRSRLENNNRAKQMQALLSNLEVKIAQTGLGSLKTSQDNFTQILAINDLALKSLEEEGGIQQAKTEVLKQINQTYNLTKTLMNDMSQLEPRARERISRFTQQIENLVQQVVQSKDFNEEHFRKYKTIIEDVTKPFLETLPKKSSLQIMAERIQESASNMVAKTTQDKRSVVDELNQLVSGVMNTQRTQALKDKARRNAFQTGDPTLTQRQIVYDPMTGRPMVQPPVPAVSANTTQQVAPAPRRTQDAMQSVRIATQIENAINKEVTKDKFLGVTLGQTGEIDENDLNRLVNSFTIGDFINTDGPLKTAFQENGYIQLDPTRVTMNTSLIKPGQSDPFKDQYAISLSNQEKQGLLQKNDLSKKIQILIDPKWPIAKQLSKFESFNTEDRQKDAESIVKSEISEMLDYHYQNIRKEDDFSQYLISTSLMKTPVREIQKKIVSRSKPTMQKQSNFYTQINDVIQSQRPIIQQTFQELEQQTQNEGKNIFQENLVEEQIIKATQAIKTVYTENQNNDSRTDFQQTVFEASKVLEDTINKMQPQPRNYKDMESDEKEILAISSQTNTLFDIGIPIFNNTYEGLIKSAEQFDFIRIAQENGDIIDEEDFRAYQARYGGEIDSFIKSKDDISAMKAHLIDQMQKCTVLVPLVNRGKNIAGMIDAKFNSSQSSHLSPQNYNNLAQTLVKARAFSDLASNSLEQVTGTIRAITSVLNSVQQSTGQQPLPDTDRNNQSIISATAYNIVDSIISSELSRGVSAQQKVNVDMDEIVEEPMEEEEEKAQTFMEVDNQQFNELLDGTLDKVNASQPLPPQITPAQQRNSSMMQQVRGRESVYSINSSRGGLYSQVLQSMDSSASSLGIKRPLRARSQLRRIQEEEEEEDAKEAPTRERGAPQKQRAQSTRGRQTATGGGGGGGGPPEDDPMGGGGGGGRGKKDDDEDDEDRRRQRDLARRRLESDERSPPKKKAKKGEEKKQEEKEEKKKEEVKKPEPPKKAAAAAPAEEEKKEGTIELAGTESIALHGGLDNEGTLHSLLTDLDSERKEETKKDISKVVSDSPALKKDLNNVVAGLVNETQDKKKKLDQNNLQTMAVQADLIKAASKDIKAMKTRSKSVKKKDLLEVAKETTEQRRVETRRSKIGQQRQQIVAGQVPQPPAQAQPPPPPPQPQPPKKDSAMKDLSSQPAQQKGPPMSQQTAPAAAAQAKKDDEMNEKQAKENQKKAEQEAKEKEKQAKKDLDERKKKLKEDILNQSKLSNQVQTKINQQKNLPAQQKQAVVANIKDVTSSFEKAVTVSRKTFQKTQEEEKKEYKALQDDSAKSILQVGKDISARIQNDKQKVINDLKGNLDDIQKKIDSDLEKTLQNIATRTASGDSQIKKNIGQFKKDIRDFIQTQQAVLDKSAAEILANDPTRTKVEKDLLAKLKAMKDESFKKTIDEKIDESVKTLYNDYIKDLDGLVESVNKYKTANSAMKLQIAKYEEMEKTYAEETNNVQKETLKKLEENLLDRQVKNAQTFTSRMDEIQKLHNDYLTKTELLSEKVFKSQADQKQLEDLKKEKEAQFAKQKEEIKKENEEAAKQELEKARQKAKEELDKYKKEVENEYHAKRNKIQDEADEEMKKEDARHQFKLEEEKAHTFTAKEDYRKKIHEQWKQIRDAERKYDALFTDYINAGLQRKVSEQIIKNEMQAKHNAELAKAHELINQNLTNQLNDKIRMIKDFKIDSDHVNNLARQQVASNKAQAAQQPSAAGAASGSNMRSGRRPPGHYASSARVSRPTASQTRPQAAQQSQQGGILNYPLGRPVRKGTPRPVSVSRSKPRRMGDRLKKKKKVKRLLGHHIVAAAIRKHKEDKKSK